ncbi:gamma-glutamyl-gamma-aminobutyrate hydrolase family protein [Bacteroidota bacterium]
MKKIFSFFAITFIYLNVAYSQENNLILVHPTEYNLKLFTYLIDNNIIDIDNLSITGIYHKNEVYDYSKSESFLAKNNYPSIALKEITEDIKVDQLYQLNECTKVYSELFKKSKGVLFFGGPDLPPAIYGEQMSLLTRMIDPYRHYFEASFLFHLLGGSQNSEFNPLLKENPDYTVYAICLGMQTINIATGGTMVQDIPSEIYNLEFVEGVLQIDNNRQHRNYYNNISIDSTLFSGSFHEIKIINQKALVGDYNKNLNPLIYSNHHQAIESLGEDLVVLATSTDGKNN